MIMKPPCQKVFSCPSHQALAFPIQFNFPASSTKFYLLFLCFLVRLEGAGRNRNTREKMKWKIYL